MVANFPARNNPYGQGPDAGARFPAGARPMYDEARGTRTACLSRSRGRRACLGRDRMALAFSRPTRSSSAARAGAGLSIRPASLVSTGPSTARGGTSTSARSPAAGGRTSCRSGSSLMATARGPPSSTSGVAPECAPRGSRSAASASWRDLERLLSEVGRGLRPGGLFGSLLIRGVPIKRRARHPVALGFWLVRRLPGWRRRARIGPISEFTRSLGRAGLEKLRCEASGVHIAVLARRRSEQRS